MEKKITVFVLTLLATAFIAASVFAYYPFQLTVQPVESPIRFLAGSNANQTDLGANRIIQVLLGANQTSAEIVIHPTYQVTYYKDVVRITNTDSKAHNIFLVLDQINDNLPTGSKVWLIIFNSGATRDLPATYPQPGTPNGAVKVIELTATSVNSPQHIGSLSSNSIWEIDIMVYIPEGTSIATASATFRLHVVYTPSSETPP